MNAARALLTVLDANGYTVTTTPPRRGALGRAAEYGETETWAALLHERKDA